MKVSGRRSPRSASPPREPGPAVPLNRLLEGVIDDLGLRRKLAEYRVLMSWDEVVGPILAQQAQPLRIHKGRLEVAVPSAVWRSQLSFMQRDIVARLNELASESVIEELVLLNKR